MRVVLENGFRVTTPIPGPPFADGFVLENDPVDVDVLPPGVPNPATVRG